MTVITKPLSQQEKDKKDVTGEKTMEEVALKGERNTTEDVESAIVISPPKRPGKSQSSNMCMIVMVMLATCLGLTILGYYQLHRRHHSGLYRRGTCRLPCHMRRQQQQQQLCRRRKSSFRNEPPKDVLFGKPPRDGAALVFGDLGSWQDNHEEQPLIRTDIDLTETRESEIDEMDNDTFKMTFEFDVEEEKFELIQMPDVSDGVYVHDFTVNRTAIIENSRCFVMLMDRNDIAPPRSLLELLMKTSKDGYEMNLDEIQHDMMIVLPELTNDETFEKYGWFIGKACHEKTIYKLELVPEEIAALQDDLDEGMEVELFNELKGSEIRRQKRSTMKAKKFQEISKALISYNIVNYDVAEQ